MRPGPGDSRRKRRVGDRIEHALVRSGCAFAHDVKEALGQDGNVDHVVLTPAGVWVVETKSAWLDGKRFKQALRQTSDNVRRVREKLGTSLPVRGALVIADDSKPYEQGFRLARRAGEGVPAGVVLETASDGLRRG
ncbi:MAG: NERD domain-containing protein [Gammaproteobacteria bacterium]|nr:NERD domain-containing protein [Gammaproteobacteria bacterium]